MCLPNKGSKESFEMGIKDNTDKIMLKINGVSSTQMLYLA